MFSILDLTAQMTGKEVWVIGDIHGEFALLETLLRKIHYQPDTHLIVTAGDMVDRGPNSPAVVAWFRRRGYAVRGNHEVMWLETLAAGLPYEGDQVCAAWMLRNQGERFITNGMDKTLLQFMEAQTPALNWLSYFNALPYAIVLGEWLIVHAGVRPERSFAEQSESDLVWIRDAEAIPSAARMGKRLVCGHTQTFHLGSLGRAIIREDVVRIDIGTADGIALAAFCLNNEDVVMVDHPNRAEAERRIQAAQAFQTV